jgi:hypothetical protein
VILVEVQQHPLRLTIGGLAERIVADSDDVTDVETARDAIRDLWRASQAATE